MVDDFGVKSVGKQHAEHQIQVIQEHFQVSTDWEGKCYCGISIKWKNQKQFVNLSILGYIQSALHKFQRIRTTRKEHAHISKNNLTMEQPKNLPRQMKHQENYLEKES